MLHEGEFQSFRIKSDQDVFIFDATKMCSNLQLNAVSDNVVDLLAKQGSEGWQGLLSSTGSIPTMPHDKVHLPSHPLCSSSLMQHLDIEYVAIPTDAKAQAYIGEEIGSAEVKGAVLLTGYGATDTSILAVV